LLGLLKAVEIEVERVSKSGLLQLNVHVEGTPYELGEQCELVLFRIFQESLNNSLKHANAYNFNIHLQFKAESFTLTLADDGQGFAVQDKLNEFSGSGLRNIESRAALIGAIATINSSPGNGCTISLQLNHLIPQTDVIGCHPDRIS
jgi:signal transduction histidine kinase